MHNSSESLLSVETVPSLTVKWRRAAPGGVTGTPAVVEGVVYFGDWSGWVRAVAASDGSLIWENKVTERRIAASLLVTEDVVYAAAFDGTMFALDRSTGDTLWSAPIDDRPDIGIFSSPILAGDAIIVGTVKVPTGDYRLGVVALDAADGTERWRTYTDTGDGDTGWSAAVWSTAAVDQERGTLYIGTGNTNWRDGATQLPDSPYANAVMALRLSDGGVEWVYRLVENDRADLDVGASPNLFTLGERDVVGVGAKSGDYAVVDRDTGELIWRVKLSNGSAAGGVQATAAVHDGRIYVASNDGLFGDTLIFALDAADGTTVWEQRLASPNLAAVALANGVLYVTASGAGRPSEAALYALDAADGSVLWSDPLPTLAGGAPSVADGAVFVGVGFGLPPAMLPDRKGELIAYALP